MNDIEAQSSEREVLEHDLQKRTNTTNTHLAEGVPASPAAHNSYNELLMRAQECAASDLLEETQRKMKLAQYQFSLIYIFLVYVPLIIFYDNIFNMESEPNCLFIYILYTWLLLMGLLEKYEQVLLKAISNRDPQRKRVQRKCILKLIQQIIFSIAKILAVILAVGCFLFLVFALTEIKLNI